MSDDDQPGPAWGGWDTPARDEPRMKAVQSMDTMTRNALERAMVLAGDRGNAADRAVRFGELEAFAGQIQQLFTVPIRELTGLIADPALLFRNAGLSPPEIVEALPETDNFAGRLVFLTTDSKLYRHTGSPAGADGFSLEVDGADIDNGTITGDKIVANTITGGLLATSGIITQAAQIGNAVISTAAIQDGAITNALIQNGAITNAKIQNGAITNAKIENLAVTNAKVANGAITNAKFSGTLQSDNYNSSQGWLIDKGGNAIFNTLTLRNGIVGGNALADLAVAAAKLANGAVATPKIQDLAVDTIKIANGGVSRLRDVTGIDFTTTSFSFVTAASISFSPFSTNSSLIINCSGVINASGGDPPYEIEIQWRGNRIGGSFQMGNTPSNTEQYNFSIIIPITTTSSSTLSVRLRRPDGSGISARFQGTLSCVEVQK